VTTIRFPASLDVAPVLNRLRLSSGSPEDPSAIAVGCWSGLRLLGGCHERLGTASRLHQFGLLKPDLGCGHDCLSAEHDWYDQSLDRVNPT
jgi:hypothetical protein